MSHLALILYNPTAGQASETLVQLTLAAEIWRGAGWQVTLQPTRFAGDGTLQAKAAAAAGYDLVVAAGGDGTVNEVVNGLVGTQTALATLPCGTVNIWAREMGLAMDIPQAARAYLQAELRQLDLGVCRQRPAKAPKAIEPPLEPPIPGPAIAAEPPSPGPALPEPAAQAESPDRYFLLMASAGFDAAVTAEVKSEEKQRLGAIAYIKQAFQTACRYRGIKTKLYIDGKRIRGRVLMVVIGNSQLYGGVIKFTAHALVDDGLLDVCVIQGRTLLSAPQRLLSVFTRFYNQGDNPLRYYRARTIEIRGKKKKKRLPVQVDGDYLGKTPMRFEVVPQGLWALVPAGSDASLWSRSSPAIAPLDRQADRQADRHIAQRENQQADQRAPEAETLC